MIEIPSIITIVVLVVGCYFLLNLIDAKLGNSFKPRVVDQTVMFDNNAEINKLREQIDRQKQLFIEQLAAQAALFETKLEQQKEIFERKIKVLEQHNEYLMQRLMAQERPLANSSKTVSTRTLFISSENEFYQRDRTTLFRSGVKFISLHGANSTVIQKELRAARNENNPFKVVIISAHGNEEGILLDDGLKDSQFWADVLFEVDLAFFTSCKSFGILNDLVGIVQYSIGMMDNIETELAEDFVYLFFREFTIYKNPKIAFQNAINTMPEISDRVTIRYRG